jgi:uncharacterized protein YjbI with pentapeptide repeats
MTRSSGRGATTGGEIPARGHAPFDGDALGADQDYEAVAFTDRDLAGQVADDSRFLDCRLERCCVDGLSLRRTRIVESALSNVHGTSVDLADSTWRDSRMTGGRLGAAMLTGADWNGVRIRGSRLGFVDLAGAVLEDVVFEGCAIGSMDVRSARLRSVAFVDCTVDELDVAGATLSKVDLSRAALRSLVGVQSLRGAIVSHAQLLDLAPLLAAQLGLAVRDD